MNKLIEIALTVLAVMFLLAVIIGVVAVAVVVFLDLVDGIRSGWHTFRRQVKRALKREA